MIDTRSVALFVPAGLRKFKLDLFERIGAKVVALGGQVVRHDPAMLEQLPADIVPIVGCSYELRDIIKRWMATGRRFIYWDRGYARRVFATWLPRGEDGGYYRWHLGAFQLRALGDQPDDRWHALRVPLMPWRKSARHIVIAEPSLPYQRFHGVEGWTERTIEALAQVTDRPLVVRNKESKRPLQADLAGAHALVTHGSIAAVEAVICGCPVFVDASSAAALVGETDLARIETPNITGRRRWLNALAYSQFNERELVDGTLWRLLA